MKKDTCLILHDTVTLWFHSVIQTVFFLFDSQECPSGRVFTRGSTIVFAPCIHANEKFQVAALLLIILTLTKPPNTWKSQYLGRDTVDLSTHFKARPISQTSQFDIPSSR